MSKVSIIVPVYNKEKYVRQCIDSLVGQTHTDIEIVLVDDESTDSSGDICDEYAAKDNRIKVIHQKNTGLVGAWKRGVNEASGDYICFVDSDDWVDTDMLERMLACTDGTEDELVVSDAIIERNSGSEPVYQPIKPGIYDREDIENDIIPKLWGYEDRYINRSRCSKLFSMDLVKRNACYGDERLRFGEDCSLSQPCIIDAKRIVMMDHAAMYHYRFVDDSMVHAYDRTMLDSIRLVQKITEQIIRDKFDTKQPEYVEKCRREYIFMLIYAIKNEIRGEKSTYISKIQSICNDPETAEIIHREQVEISSGANKLVYRVLKNPSAMNCRILRLAMNLKR